MGALGAMRSVCCARRYATLGATLFCWIGRLENATRAIFRKQREAIEGAEALWRDTGKRGARQFASRSGPDSQPQASQFTASKLHAYAVSSSAANAAGAKLSALGVAQLARRKFAAPRANAATLPKADPHVPARHAASPAAPSPAAPHPRALADTQSKMAKLALALSPPRPSPSWPPASRPPPRSSSRATSASTRAVDLRPFWDDQEASPPRAVEIKHGRISMMAFSA